MLIWPAPVSGYGLQTAADAQNPTWQSVAQPIQVVSGTYRVMVPLGTARSFYRLFHP